MDKNTTKDFSTSGETVTIVSGVRKNEFESLKDVVDNGTMYTEVRHAYKSNFLGQTREDVCLSMFGAENEECIEYNKKHGKKD